MHADANEIDAAAALWATRLSGGSLTRDDAMALDVWLAKDARHRGALLRAQAGLFVVAAECEAPPIAPAAPRVRRCWTATALAACVAWMIVTASQPAEYQTERGEIAEVAMEDGSTATLSGGTHIVSVIGTERRDITLDRGEAWFAVTRDRDRPFTVTAGRVRVQATGTAFAVRYDPGGVRVVVTEGSVAAWDEGCPGIRTRLVAGEVATLATKGATWRRGAASDVRTALAWRRGEIVLDNTAVGAAVAEFNRYNDLQLRVSDAAVARLRMDGYFRINQPEAFAKAVGNLSGATLQKSSREIVIK